MIALIGISIGTRAAAQEPSDTWNLSVGIQEFNQFDRVESGEPREDLIVDYANIDFDYSTLGERSRLSLFARAGISYFREGEPTDRRDQLDFGAGFTWDQRLTERFDSTLGVNVSKDFSLQRLAQLGIIAPDLNGYSGNAMWLTQYRAGSRTNLLTSVNVSYQEIGSSRPIPGGQIVLDEQPFGDGLSVPTTEPSPEELQVPDAQDDLLRILATEGLRDTRNRSQFALAKFGLNHAVSQRSTLGFEIGGGYRVFDLGFEQEGAVVMGRFFAQRDVSDTASLNAAYDLERSLALDPDTTVQSLIGGFTKSNDQRSFSFMFNGGVSHYDGEGLASQLAPVANISLSAYVTASTTGEVAYRRQFSNALGFGQTLLIDYARASLMQELGSRIEATLEAGATYSTDPLDESFRTSALLMGGAVTVDIIGGLSAGTSLFLNETDFSTSDTDLETREKLWSVFLAYAASWH